MGTFYVGPRPVLRGRTESELSDAFLNGTVGDKATNKHYQQGRGSNAAGLQKKVGVYSYYPLFGPGLLTGAPDNNHVPGTGIYPHAIFLSRVFLGLQTSARKTSLLAPGLGPRLAYAGGRFRPLEYKGLDSDRVFPAHMGHGFRDPVRVEFTWASWSNYYFAGLPSAQALPDAQLGHKLRSIGAAGAPATFGAFQPYIYKGVDPTLKEGSITRHGEQSTALGEAIPSGHDNAYGHNRVNEWFGVPSAKAL